MAKWAQEDVETSCNLLNNNNNNNNNNNKFIGIILPVWFHESEMLSLAGRNFSTRKIQQSFPCLPRPISHSSNCCSRYHITTKSHTVTEFWRKYSTNTMQYLLSVYYD
jgi:hypothetical protein